MINHIPNLVAMLEKTVGSKNITIEDWNTLQHQITLILEHSEIYNSMFEDGTFTAQVANVLSDVEGENLVPIQSFLNTLIERIKANDAKSESIKSALESWRILVEGYKTDAEAAKDTAVDAANTAVEAAEEALIYRDNAYVYATDGQRYCDNAEYYTEKSQEYAETAIDAAEKAQSHEQAVKEYSYSKTEVDAIVSALRRGRYISTDELPTEDIDEAAIYLIPKTDGEESDVKNEYIYLVPKTDDGEPDYANAKWELIGNTAVDLTEYVKKTDYASKTPNGVGVIKLNNYSSGLVNEHPETDGMYIWTATNMQIQNRTVCRNPLTPEHTDLVVKEGITNNSTELTVEEQTTAREWLGAASKVELDNVKENVLMPTEGLEYTLSDNGTYYICTGIGTVIDEIIHIAEYYNGVYVLEIAAKAFEGCTSITRVEIPRTCYRIGASAFANCTSLQVVIMENGAYPMQLDDKVFSGCTALMGIMLPNGLLSLPQEMFYGCKALDSIELPPTLRKIGNYAFSGCEALRWIDIPEPLLSIGIEAFLGCTNLEDIRNYSNLRFSLGSDDYGGIAKYATRVTNHNPGIANYFNKNDTKNTERVHSSTIFDHFKLGVNNEGDDYKTTYNADYIYHGKNGKIIRLPIANTETADVTLATTKDMERNVNLSGDQLIGGIKMFADLRVGKGWNALTEAQTSYKTNAITYPVESQESGGFRRAQLSFPAVEGAHIIATREWTNDALNVLSPLITRKSVDVYTINRGLRFPLEPSTLYLYVSTAGANDIGLEIVNSDGSNALTAQDISGTDIANYRFGALIIPQTCQGEVDDDAKRLCFMLGVSKGVLSDTPTSKIISYEQGASNGFTEKSNGICNLGRLALKNNAETANATYVWRIRL